MNGKGQIAAVAAKPQEDSKRKRVICDSSSLISMSMNCMMPIIIELSEYADFVITKTVYDEIITTPQEGGRHRMGPLNFKALIKSGILKIEEADKSEANRILDASNNVYFMRRRPLKIIHLGEAEALALANNGDVLLMDERTLRFLVENPWELKDLLEHRLHEKVFFDKQKDEVFRNYCKGVSIIRSSEIVAVAHEKGILQKYFSGDRREVLEACLWSLKFSGCSLSGDDIGEYLKMLK